MEKTEREIKREREGGVVAIDIEVEREIKNEKMMERGAEEENIEIEGER